ncbi:transmembrane protein, putative (macronuclear) [Tetrahymena thermophila SB210]|uniref:Transmembrane protein, putative n=1 Tax=Tetrahymena thermophila (strain SB210) TaxID=312017 RepID=W7XAC2_TETTS|nr:transmembrane protein, putative [Tetrahymena thermophila SB210]EWS76320.1 transmembrane protein, putative [Tetrahymena thermophila SB210]|eukprot:XP_012651104.1 transmembrane protein, putative [Tetrahymena thermophila SB210]
MSSILICSQFDVRFIAAPSLATKVLYYKLANLLIASQPFKMIQSTQVIQFYTQGRSQPVEGTLSMEFYITQSIQNDIQTKICKYNIQQRFFSNIFYFILLISLFSICLYQLFNTQSAYSVFYLN